MNGQSKGQSQGQHIDCKKDTYHVLKNTITPKLNEDLKLLMENDTKVLIFKNMVCPNGDDTSPMYISQKGKYNNNMPDIRPTFLCPCSNEKVDDSLLEFVKACDIRVVFTGDLAWYTAALGKVNMSGNWCTQCKLNKKEWTNHRQEKGVEWTLAAMNALREKLNMYEITDTPMNRKGVVDVILFESVSIRLYIYPILHSEIGLGNFVLNSFFLWVNYRIENVT